ncbi:hypothetical protein GGH92_003252 [Coemansia sp. RSA 2673]|nr:hypothetical protein GGH92_003252 [Coemansia sp. RSA 2673]
MANAKTTRSTLDDTPCTHRFKSTTDISNASSAKGELDNAAKIEAESLAKKRIRLDCDVLAMACPRDKAARSVAAKSAKLVLEALESLLSPLPNDQAAKLPSELNTLGLRDRLTMLAEASRPWLLPSTHPDADPLSKEKGIYSFFRDVVLFVMECLKALHAGSDVREHYRLLLPNSTGSDSRGKDSTQGFKVDQVLVLRPWSDEIRRGTKEWHYADILAVVEAKVSDSARAVGMASLSLGSDRPSHISGPTPPKLRNAQGHMVCYSRHIYESQHSRVFIWGLTICGSLVRVYHSGPDCVLSSSDLDVRDADGRRQFVEWFVNMSLGEDEQRGFNPAVQLVDDKKRGKYWKIDVSATTDEGYHASCTDCSTTSYYSRGPTVVAGSSFGRNTRGFPAPKDIDNIDVPDVFVKTAWQHAERGLGSTRLSELDCLKRIKKEFGSGKPGINVPIIESGGVMAKRLSDGTLMPLTTDTLYGSDIIKRHGNVDGSQATGELGNGDLHPPESRHIEDADPDPFLEPPPSFISFRQQYALVTDKICEPLSSVKSADELIVVLADTMRAHSWILENCSLLHRDISANNIMVERKKDANGNPSINGMLIDFDCAIDPSVERVVRPERTGTLPFMSVLNLERHAGRRTELDDWESLLYVLCWMVTFGINQDDRQALETVRKQMGDEDLKILDWRSGRTMKGIASSKRNHLCLSDTFNANITSRIWSPNQGTEVPDYFYLRILAEGLYEAMFQNEDVDKCCRGAVARSVASGLLHNRARDGSGLQSSFYDMTLAARGASAAHAQDPFIERRKDKPRTIIIDSLIQVIEEHATYAKERMSKALST